MRAALCSRRLGWQMFFLFPWTRAAQSPLKTHPSGRAPGIVRGRGSPHAGSLRQMQAPGEPEAPALFKPGWGGGSRHRVKSSVGQPRCAGTQPGPPVGLPAWPGARLSPRCVSKFLPPLLYMAALSAICRAELPRRFQSGLLATLQWSRLLSEWL